MGASQLLDACPPSQDHLTRRHWMLLFVLACVQFCHVFDFIIMVPLGPYADNMRVVAQQHEIPLFDRLAIMRHWSDIGAFDLYAAGKDNVLAQRVHDCIGRGIASMIIDAAHLHPEKAAQ